MMATVPHVTFGLGLRKFQADGFLLTRVYVQRNIEARPCNHCCRGRAVSITYCECVFVAFGIQHAMRLNYIVICGLRGSTIFFHALIEGKDFRRSY